MAYETSTDGLDQGPRPKRPARKSNAPYCCPECGNEGAAMYQWRDLECQRNCAIFVAVVAILTAVGIYLGGTP